MISGYSGTSLAKKLGFKPGDAVLVLNKPAHYLDLFTDLPVDIRWDREGDLDAVHFFTQSAQEYKNVLPQIKDKIKKTGMIWISWPKKSSNVKADIDENLIRDTALNFGLVDIKVCAVDEIWSGLKLVWRKENR